MDNVRFSSALWVGLVLIASITQRWIAVSIAPIEIVVGAIAGNLVDLTLTPWVNYLAGFGAILLTFLAGAEIDVDERQYTILLTAVIGSAVVPTLIAERWFQPVFKLLGSSAGAESESVVPARFVACTGRSWWRTTARPVRCAR